MNNSFSKIDAVTYSYPSSEWKLQSISLNIVFGDFIGIIGPNGCGKSTLIKIAAGILKPLSGSVSLLGQDMKNLSRPHIARCLGYLPQNINPTFDYSVEEIAAMGRFPHLKGFGFMTKDDFEYVNRCLEMTDTAAFKNRFFSQLSGGERQRVMLASVLAQNPKLLLLDEPTTGLDLHHQVAFFSLLKKLAKTGIAVAVVTHDLNLASLFCSRILLLKNGEKIAFGTVEEVITQQNINSIYPDKVYISAHPVTAKPMIVPLDTSDRDDKGNQNG